MLTVSRKIERLINLTIALLATKRYLTKSEIFRSVEGYEGSAETKERMFERDKDDLRSLGIEIEVGSFDLHLSHVRPPPRASRAGAVARRDAVCVNRALRLARRRALLRVRARHRRVRVQRPLPRRGRAAPARRRAARRRRRARAVGGPGRTTGARRAAGPALRAPALRQRRPLPLGLPACRRARAMPGGAGLADRRRPGRGPGRRTGRDRLRLRL